MELLEKTRSEILFASSEDTIELFIDGLPPSPNAVHSVHQKMVVKKYWRELVGKTALVAKVRRRIKTPYAKAKVHFAILVADNRVHDADNLNWSVTKPALDGLKNILLLDDSIDHVILSYEYSRSKPRGFFIFITPLP